MQAAMTISGTIAPSLPFIVFSPRGWRKLARANQRLAARAIKACVMRMELSRYIAAHKAAGYGLDPVCLELRYMEGLYVQLHESAGEWYIDDVIVTHDGPVTFKPVYGWETFKRGASTLLRRVLYGWQMIMAGPAWR